MVKTIFTILFSLTMGFVLSKDLDSLILEHKNCINNLDCHTILLQICESSSLERKRETLDIYANELGTLLKNIEDVELKFEGYLLIGQCYFDLQDYVVADSLFNLSKSFALNIKNKYKVLRPSSLLYLRAGKLDKGLKQISEILDLDISKLDTTEQALIYLNKAAFLVEKGNTISAIKQYQKAKSILHSSNNAEIKAVINHGLIICYGNSLQAEKRLQLAFENLDIAQQSKNNHLEMFSIYTILHNLLEMQEYEDVLSYGHKAIALKNKTNYSAAFGYNYACMAEAFIGLDQLDSAHHYSSLGIEFSKNVNESKELADNLAQKAFAYEMQGKYIKAKEKIEECLAIRNRTASKEHHLHAYLLSKLGADAEAYQVLKKIYKYKFSQIKLNEVYQQAISVLEDKLSIEQEQKSQNYDFQFNVNLYQNSIYLLIFAVLLISFLISFRFYSSKKVRKLNASLNIQNKRLEQFMYIASHDLNAPIQTISGFSDLLLKSNLNSTINPGLKKDLKTISTNSTILTSIMKELKQFVMHALQEKEAEILEIRKVSQIVERNLEAFLQKINGSLQFSIDKSIEHLTCNQESLVILIQSLIQHYVEQNQSVAPALNILVTKKLSKLKFDIRDTSIADTSEELFIPFRKNTLGTSRLPLSICKDILEKNGGDILIKSSKNYEFGFTLAIDSQL